MPFISVVIPIYNVESFLEQCLSSITKQSLSSIEVICVDDGSSDGSGSIADTFAARDRRFKVIHKQNAGYGCAVNTGIAQACGEYISIIEPDDYIDIDMLAKLYHAAESNAFPDVVKSAYWRVCNAGTPEETIVAANYYRCVSRVNTPFTLDEDAEFLFHHPSIWSAIYRREFLDRSGITMPEIPGAGWADNPWLVETLCQAKSIVYIDECLYYYREFNAGSSSMVKDPSIIFNRWIEMDDIVKRLGVTSERILEGHFNRGCAYIQMLQLEFNPKDPIVKSGLNEMMQRMDYAAVRTSQKIPVEYKFAYYQQRGPMCYLKHRVSTKLRALLHR